MKAIKNFMAVLADRIIPRYERHAFRVGYNRMKRMAVKEPRHKYLFILAPPYSGSTLLNEILSTSHSVSVNNTSGSREGQTLPAVREIMFGPRRWDESLDFDWRVIEMEWRKYWDTTRPVLLEKSPPNIIRAASIQKAFEPSLFIVLHRNPYAQCESLIRRNGMKAGEAAEFALKCLKYQRENIRKLDNCLHLPYEMLTSDMEMTAKKLSDFLSELSDIETGKKFTAYNFTGKRMEVENLDDVKIKKLSTEQLKEINAVFIRDREILDFFAYPVTGGDAATLF